MRTLRNEMIKWKRATNYKEQLDKTGHKPHYRPAPAAYQIKHYDEEESRYWEGLMGRNRPTYRRYRGAFRQR